MTALKYLRGLLVALAMLALPVGAVAAPITYLNADNINQTPVSAANPLPVNATVTATATVGVTAVTSTPGSTLTVTTGNTFQSVFASNASRNGCLIQNPITATETLYVFFGANGSATTAKSIELGAGSAVSCAVGGLAVDTDNVSVTAATSTHAFKANQQ